MTTVRRAWLDLSAQLPAAAAKVAYAAEHQPMLGALLAAAGIDPAAVRGDADFRAIPPTTKADYRRGFPAGVVTTALPLDHPRLLLTRSSGTGGERLVTVASKLDLSRRVHRGLALNPRLSAAMRARDGATCRYAPPNCSAVECASPMTSRADRTLDDGTLVLPVAHDVLAASPELVDGAIHELADVRPRRLDAEATHLAFLLRGCAERGVVPASPAAITLSYSSPARVARAAITAAFPRSCVAAVVMMSEFGWVAVECEAGRLHLNTGAFAPELVRGGAPVGEGEVGELLLTSLGDRVLPHVRYRTGDAYRLIGACPCGNPGGSPAVVFEGRLRHMVVRDGEIALTPEGLDALVGAQGWLVAYRLTQRADGSLRFDYVPGDADADAGHGVRSLRDALLDAVGPVPLEVEAVRHIPADRTGKFLSCCSEVAGAGALEGWT